MPWSDGLAQAESLLSARAVPDDSLSFPTTHIPTTELDPWAIGERGRRVFLIRMASGRERTPD